MVHTPTNDFIRNLNIKEGETLTMDCPICNGVKKFTATNKEGLVLYNCYRNSCDVKGATITNMLAETVKNKIQGKEEKVEQKKFEMPEYITDGNNSYVQRFIRRWGLNINLMYDVKNKRAVFPIYKNGRMIDAIGRALYNAQPKWYKYGGMAKYYSYCINPSKSVSVVVEDVVSAITVSMSFPQAEGVAILGTSLSYAHKEFMQRYDKVMIALDPDAKKKTLAFTKEMRNYVDDVVAINLVDDIKYKKDTDMNTIRRTIASWN